jgi:MerR family transcriptional regulator, copper efflux regulator
MERARENDAPRPAEGEPDLVPIDEVARRLGLRASAIRYYEERGLVEPASRQAGRRWYGPDEIRRLAVILYWQRSGLMSLEEIGDILAGPAATRGWAQIVQERIDALRIQAEHMDAARAHLEHVLSHHRDYASPPDGCHLYEEALVPAAIRLAGHGSPSAGGTRDRPARLPIN